MNRSPRRLRLPLPPPGEPPRSLSRRHRHPFRGDPPEASRPLPRPSHPIPPASTGGLVAVAQVPPAVPRPSGDPFQEPPEARPPRGIALDEKLEYFRSVLKLKEETLARARTVYEQRDLESTRLREVAVALKAQLDEVLPQLGQLRYLPARLEQLQAALEQERLRGDTAEGQASQLEQHLASSEADRRDLARALAEVEAELPGLRAGLEEEKLARAALAEELANVKEALESTEEKARQLEVEKLEAMGSLDAVNGQYQEMATIADKLEQDLQRVSEEARSLVAERDAAAHEKEQLSSQLGRSPARRTSSGTTSAAPAGR